MEKETMFDKILEIDDFYSLVDYAEFNNVNTCLVSDLYNVNTNGLNSIRINFNIGNQSKEIVVKKSTAKRIYTFIQIIHNDLRMNILVKNTEECYAQNLLKKINSNFMIRGFIFIHLKISEFPLKNYFLEEINKKVDGFDKIFLLKKINFNQHSNNNINQMGNFSFFNPIINNNANNFSHLNNNLIQSNTSENIANLKQRNNDLEKMLNEEKNKNKI